MKALWGGPWRIGAGLADYWRDARCRRRCVAGEGTRLLSTGKIYNQQVTREAIKVGSFTWIAGELLVFPASGQITVGDFCYVGDGVRVWSAADVSIGNRVFLSHGVNIHDNDAHSLSARERHAHFRELVTLGRASFVESMTSAAIAIEDDVWVGFNSAILKGVRLGRGSVVGACSVVTRDVAPYAIVAGNPAVVIGQALP